MKITKSQLKQIIKEELETVLSETESDDMKWHKLVMDFNKIRVPDPERAEGRKLNIYAQMQSGPGVSKPYVYITSGGGYGTQASRHVVARFMTPESFKKVIDRFGEAYKIAREEVANAPYLVFADEVAEQYEKMVEEASDSVERPGQDVPQPK
tara:strand:- start:3174 stop:3632 length:459 start_codon:yes stop_codon:yes gene_type:complete